MGFLNKKPIVKTEGFQPIDLNEDNVQAIFNRCLAEDGTAETTASSLYFSSLGWEKDSNCLLNVPLRLTGKNICSILSIGESQNSQLSGEVHTPVGPQTFMGLVGHHNHPERRELP